jgi:hypothetical protein
LLKSFALFSSYHRLSKAWILKLLRGFGFPQMAECLTQPGCDVQQIKVIQLFVAHLKKIAQTGSRAALDLLHQILLVPKVAPVGPRAASQSLDLGLA